MSSVTNLGILKTMNFINSDLRFMNLKFLNIVDVFIHNLGILRTMNFINSDLEFLNNVNVFKFIHHFPKIPHLNEVDDQRHDILGDRANS